MSNIGKILKWWSKVFCLLIIIFLIIVGFIFNLKEYNRDYFAELVVMIKNNSDFGNEEIGYSVYYKTRKNNVTYNTEIFYDNSTNEIFLFLEEDCIKYCYMLKIKISKSDINIKKYTYFCYYYFDTDLSGKPNDSFFLQRVIDVENFYKTKELTIEASNCNGENLENLFDNASKLLNCLTKNVNIIIKNNGLNFGLEKFGIKQIK